MTTTNEQNPQNLRQRLNALGLRAVAERLDEFQEPDSLLRLVEIEESHRSQRGLERRLRNAKLGRFKPMADFDPTWPTEIDHDQLQELFTLGFIEQAANVILFGSNGLGKTMIAKNLAHQAILKGHTARFITASELLNDLAAQETGSALTRRLRHYARWKLLVIDEVGYLATSARHGDLLFEVINRRYEEKSIVLTTNKLFQEWGSVFPSSSCVVTMVDRLMHRSELLRIKGDSYRKKEAEEREAKHKARRAKGKKSRPNDES